jgi:hypothetical protein
VLPSMSVNRNTTVLVSNSPGSEVIGGTIRVSFVRESLASRPPKPILAP